jgi:superfamily II RNA helicase
MKAYVSFNLNSEDDKSAFQNLANGKLSKLQCAMHEFAENTLRRVRKYGLTSEQLHEQGIVEPQMAGETPWTQEDLAQQVVTWVEKQFFEYLRAYEVSLED